MNDILLADFDADILEKMFDEENFALLGISNCS